MINQGVTFDNAEKLRYKPEALAPWDSNRVEDPALRDWAHQQFQALREHF